MTRETSLPFPDYLVQYPGVARDMENFLQATQMVDTHDPRHLCRSYDWNSLGTMPIVDVNTLLNGAIFGYLQLTRNTGEHHYSSSPCLAWESISGVKV
jgi:hypothetical protein